MSNYWEQQHGIQMEDTPENLWARIESYFKWCEANPIKQVKTVMSGKEAGKQVEVLSVRPFTLKGMCLHCGILEEYLRDVRATKEKDSLMYLVVSKALYIIHTQNSEMAMIGEYNPVFTAKMLNIDKEEAPATPVRIEVVQGLPTLLSSENEILEKLELENKLYKTD